MAIRTLPAHADEHFALAHPPGRIDAVTYLTVFLVFQYGFNGHMVLGPLGAVGAPATLLALGAMYIWVAGRLLPRAEQYGGPQLVRTMLLIHLAYLIGSYGMAMARPISSVAQSGANQYLVYTLAFTGLGLLAADGIRTYDRLRTLLRRLTYLGGAVAALGIAQFVTRSPIGLVKLPGFVWNREPSAVGARSIFMRPYSTTLHPIEFSVITAALLPLAVHFAMTEPPGRRRQAAIASAALLGLSVPLSVSRSGFVALIAGLAIAAMGWTARQRINAAILAVISVPVLWAAIPGLVGTIHGLFFDTEEDLSVQARINRFPRVMAIIREHPWFGMGHGTYTIEEFFLVDNELYVRTMSTGLIGVSLTIVLVLTGFIIALAAAQSRKDWPEFSSMSRGVAATSIALIASIPLVDAFYYRTIMATLFIMIGLAGALWRLSRSLPTPEHDRDEHRRISDARGRER